MAVYRLGKLRGPFRQLALSDAARRGLPGPVKVFGPGAGDLEFNRPACRPARNVDPFETLEAAERKSR